MTTTNEILPGDRVYFRAQNKTICRTALAVGLGYVKVLLRGSVATIPAAEITSFEIAGQS